MNAKMKTIYSKIKLIAQLIYYFGVNWLIFRLYYQLKIKSGYLRYSMPIKSWSDYSLSDLLSAKTINLSAFIQDLKSQSRFFFSSAQLSAYQSILNNSFDNNHHCIQQAEQICAGVFQYFSYQNLSLGKLPNWHQNPFTGLITPKDQHWSQIDDFANGDIKQIWELNRFSFVYTLARAYARTHDEKYAETFWQLIADWRFNNPPNSGVNWKCGQEISLRLMAWLFGLYIFINAKVSTSAQIIELIEMIYVAAERIEKNLQYALQQKNNHGITEAVGLWSVGVIFPEFKTAQRWEQKGRKALEQQARQLIYNDGGFSQNSLNYQRVMLQDYLWALCLAKKLNKKLSHQLKNKIYQSFKLLWQLQDEISGKVPCYGANDGALILPLNDCDFTDFRPVLQALHYYFKHTKCIDKGPWDEDLLWLFDETALTASVRMVHKTSLNAIHSGYYTLRSPIGFAFIRCGKLYHRPSHADMLHFDLWWRGINIALDPGTYSYNAPAPWNNALASSHYHNNVIVDGQSQSKTFSKFIALPWVKGQVICNITNQNGHLHYWEGQHDGYQRLDDPVSYRRGILQIGSEHWLVLDYLKAKQNHHYQIHFLLADVPHYFTDHKLILQTTAGEFAIQTHSSQKILDSNLVKADPLSPRGWQAPYYNSKQPVLSYAINLQGTNSLVWTLLGPNNYNCALDGNKLTITTPSWQCQLHLNRTDDNLIVSDITLKEFSNGSSELKLD